MLDVTLPQGNSPACQVQVPVVQYSPAPASNSPQASALACGEPPAAWFCADDPVTRIRCVQGSVFAQAIFLCKHIYCFPYNC